MDTERITIAKIMHLETNMPVVEIPVQKGQRLSEIETIYPLPTNGIFHKILPGLGATHGEINAPRNSIIALPNVPVIESKVEKHNKQHPKSKHILGVYKGITKEQIIDYMSNETITYKKILTTPEGYKDKVREAVKDVFDYVKREYYLLIDECERTIQDVDFREKITAPFDDFFSFTNKGLISATTLPFSDPAFESDFTHYVLKPEWNYSRHLTLIHTNNVVASLRALIINRSDEPCFIFCSSIKTICALISALDIKSDSAIFCSENRKAELRVRGFKSRSKINEDDFSKFNFLTSRFYSAVDIELSYKPDVIMVTEVTFAEHSILDPQTEVIQIPGRFRNGTNSITHIANSNPALATKTADQVRTYLDGQQDVYKQILKLQKSITNDGAQDAIRQILTQSDFAKFFKSDGSYNWFMVDNAIQEQRVLGLYKSGRELSKAYEQVSGHFKLKEVRSTYPLTDEDRLKRDTPESQRAFIKELVRQLELLHPQGIKYMFGREDALNDLIAINPDLYRAYTTIGEKGIAEANYNMSRINMATDEAKRQQSLVDPFLLREVEKHFKVGKSYTESYILAKLSRIFEKRQINQRVRPGLIDGFFKPGAPLETALKCML